MRVSQEGDAHDVWCWILLWPSTVKMVAVGSSSLHLLFCQGLEYEASSPGTEAEDFHGVEMFQ